MRFALTLLLTLTSAFAADAKKYTFRDFAPTRYVDGPRLTPAMQKDKGTILFFWAYELENPRGGESLKYFQKVADDHKDDLVVIGIENLGMAGTTKTMTALLKKAGATYTVYSGCRSPFKVNLYPFVCAFDREGKMVYSGNPKADELEEAITLAAAKPEKKDGKDEPKKDEKEKPKVDPKKAA
ncbi:MAG: hypothetical protein RJA95_433 [Verrucomicrobiota bacterium]|jgi:hypothetical protein